MNLPFFRRRPTEKGIQLWRKDIVERNKGKSLHTVDTQVETKHKAPVADSPKSVPATFYQLLNGHAMTAVSLKERWGCIDLGNYCLVPDGRTKAGASL